MRKRLLLLLALSITIMACGPVNFLTGGNNDGVSADLTEVIAIGETRSASSTDVFDVHDWSFEASASQEFAIRAAAIGDSDPRLRIIDGRGNILVENDDFETTGDDLSAQVRFFVPEDGTYVARVDFFEIGDYALSIEDITPLTAPAEE